MAATPETTGTEVPGSHHEDVGFPPFKTETFGGQILWLAITFGVLLYAMNKFIIPRIGGIIEHRHTTIRTDLEEATALKAKAQEAGKAYETALAEAKAHAQTVAHKTHEDIVAATEGRRKSLEAELLKRMQQADSQISATKTKAMTNVRGIAGEAAAAIVEQLTGKAPPAGAVEAALGSTKS